MSIMKECPAEDANIRVDSLKGSNSRVVLVISLWNLKSIT